MITPRLPRQPTPQYPSPPPQLLEELRNILLSTFRTEFETAAEKKDQQAVSRFFRLWPGIGAEEEGLEAYGDFVVGLVKTRSSGAGKREFESMNGTDAKRPPHYTTSHRSHRCWRVSRISSTSTNRSWTSTMVRVG